MNNEMKPIRNFILTFSVFSCGLMTAQGQQMSVEPKSRISAADPGVENEEVMIAADSSDPNHLLACGMARLPEGTPLGDRSQTRVFVSFDRGRTWTRSLTVNASGWVSDPSCVLGTAGVAYAAALVFEIDHRTFKGKTVLYGSGDGGKTWSLRSTFPQEGDRDFLTLDETDNHLYIIEKLLGRTLNDRVTFPLVLYDSTDGGKSFNTLGIFGDSDSHVMPGHPGGVLADGTYVNAVAETSLEVAQSMGAGPSGPRAAKIRVLLYNRDRRPDTSIIDVSDFQPCDTRLNSDPIPSLAVDRSSEVFSGRVYVSWPDGRFGNCRILISFSADSGKSWSSPLPATDGRLSDHRHRRPDQFHPTLTVSRKGVVGLFWAERPDTERRLWLPKFSASFDGGQTFSSVTLDLDGSKEDSDPETLKLQAPVFGGGSPVWHASAGVSKRTFHITIERPHFSIAGGETDGLTADADGFFHAVWVDSSVLDPQMWTARISIDGRGTQNGSNDLALLSDVSADVAVFFSDAGFDKATSTLRSNMYVRNVSNSVIDTRLVLRVLSLTSKVGEPEFINSDNKRVRAGAVFELTPLLAEKRLLPGQTMAARQVLIHLKDAPPEFPLETVPAYSGLITIDAVVLGGKPGG
jgi:hypothetical protein